MQRRDRAELPLIRNSRIDVHHHVLPELYCGALRETGAGHRSGITFPEWRLADSLEVMDRHGIGAAVASISTPGVALADRAANRALARRCNEWAAGAIRDHPRRLGAFASLPLPDVDGALAEVAFAFDELGLDGVVLLTSNPVGYLGDPIFDPLFAELDRRRAVVFIHPTTPPVPLLPSLDLPVSAVEFVADTTRAVANLIFSGTLARHPGISFIVAHAGGFAPYIAARLQQVWAGRPTVQERAPAGVFAYLRRLYYDTAMSASPYALPSVLALAGPGHLCFGTDFPFVPESVVEATIDGLAAHPGLDDAERLAVERKTALALLPGVAARLGA